MTFGWQGFHLEHPEDWAPVSLTGTRHEGYVRIASPGRLSFQVRWKGGAKTVDLPSVLSTYFDRLKGDAKSSKVAFKGDLEEQGETLLYRYFTGVHGRGALMRSPVSGRVFFLEAISPKNDSLIPVFRKLFAGFSPDPDEERWAILGLDLRLPKGLEVEKKTLQAGRTQITLSSKRVRIEAQRWGFAEQLMAKHGLESWAQSALGLPNCPAESSSNGVKFAKSGTLFTPPIIGLARVQPGRNQITTLKVSTRDETWRPSWDWFV